MAANPTPDLESPFVSDELFAPEPRDTQAERAGSQSPFLSALASGEAHLLESSVDEFVDDAVFDWEDPICAGEQESLDFEAESFDSETWTGSSDQLAFRDRVLATHLARKRKSRGPPLPDLSPDELKTLTYVPGTTEKTFPETAAAAGRLLVVANADLAMAQHAGDADALRTIRLSLSSGYRGSQEQRRLWLRYFSAKDGYYDQTQAARERLPEGPHSDQAVAYMLRPKTDGGFGLGGRIAAPGYSNHQSGIAIDFAQERLKGHGIRNKSDDASRARWRATWFHRVWLQANAATYGFNPIATEEWHWEYRQGAIAAMPTRSAVSHGSVSAPASEQVRFAQRVLNTVGGERLGDDGTLGRLTRDALGRFRARNGLGPDGVLDAKTELALVQRALEELAQASMFAQVGVRDAATYQALSAFKSARGLGVDGTLNTVTRRALTDALARRTLRSRASEDASVSDYIGGKLWTFNARTLALRVAVFCPKAALAHGGVEVLVFAHGLLSGCPRPKQVPAGFVTDSPFALGHIVDASGRSMVLVVPFLNWANPGGERAFGPGQERWHALSKPSNLNSAIAEVLTELGRIQGGAAPSLRGLIIAGHSRAYDFLEPLAHSRSDPLMRQGAMAKLSQVWAFDTTYAGRVEPWLDWLNLDPRLQVAVFYRPGSEKAPSQTAAIGKRFFERRSGRLQVTQASEAHCDVPATRLRALLEFRIAVDQETGGGGAAAARTTHEKSGFLEPFESPFLDELQLAGSQGSSGEGPVRDLPRTPFLEEFSYRETLEYANVADVLTPDQFARDDLVERLMFEPEPEKVSQPAYISESAYLKSGESAMPRWRREAAADGLERPSDGSVEPQEVLKQGLKSIDEEVLANDDRTLVTDTLRIPNRWLCAIDILVDNPAWGEIGRPKYISTSRATGVLIGPRHVLTARHVMDKQTINVKGKEQKVDVMLLGVSPARNGDNTNHPFGQAMSRVIHRATQYRPRLVLQDGRTIENPIPPDDYALIILNKDIASATHRRPKDNVSLGFWGEVPGKGQVRRLAPDIVDGKRILVTGYPGDRCGTNKIDGLSAEKATRIAYCLHRRADAWASTQWQATGIATVDASTTDLLHTADTYKGQSGGAICLAADGQVNLIGIHTDSHDDQRNKGVRVTRRMLREVCDWMNADAAQTIATIVDDCLVVRAPLKARREALDGEETAEPRVDPSLIPERGSDVDGSDAIQEIEVTGETENLVAIETTIEAGAAPGALDSGTHANDEVYESAADRRVDFEDFGPAGDDDDYEDGSIPGDQALFAEEESSLDPGESIRVDGRDVRSYVDAIAWYTARRVALLGQRSAFVKERYQFPDGLDDLVVAADVRVKAMRKLGSQPISDSHVEWMLGWLDRYVEVMHACDRKMEVIAGDRFRVTQAQINNLKEQVARLQPRLRDLQRSAFRADNTSKLKQSAETLATALDSVLVAEQWVRDAATKMEDIRVLGTTLRTQKALHGASKPWHELMRETTHAKVAKLLSVADGLNNVLAAWQLVDSGIALLTGGKTASDRASAGISFAATVASAGGTLLGASGFFSLYNNLYLGPMVKRVFGQIDQLKDKLSTGRNHPYIQMGKLDLVDWSIEPGGREMYEFMRAAMRAPGATDVPAIPAGVAKYFSKHRSAFDAGTPKRHGVDIDYADIGDKRGWVYGFRNDIWGMLYGSLPVL